MSCIPRAYDSIGFIRAQKMRVSHKVQGDAVLVRVLQRRTGRRYKSVTNIYITNRRDICILFVLISLSLSLTYRYIDRYE